MSTAAFAATLSGQSPAEVPSSATLSNVTVRVTADDLTGISSATMVLDGVPRTPFLYYAGHWEWDEGSWSDYFVEDRTQATVSYRIATPVTVGSHEVTVTVTNGMGAKSTTAWTFVVAPPETTFDTPAPQPNAVATTWNPPVSVSVFDPATLSDGPIVTIDGVSHTVAMLFGTSRISYADWEESQYNDLPGQQAQADFRIGFVTYTPAKLADGAHTAQVRVANPTGRTSTFSWSFTVAAPPVISNLSPANLSSVSTQVPAISARVEDNAPLSPSSLRMLVDGVDVPAAYDPVTGIFSYMPALPLANDRVHTVRIEAVDAGGLSAAAESAFSVQIYSDMPVSADCESCHDATQHPMDDCNACHLPIPIGHGITQTGVSRCLQCHHIASHGPNVIIPGVTWGGGDEPQEGYTGYWGNYCTYCHAPKYPSVPRHPSDNAIYHDTTGDLSACSPCHVRSLTREHNRYTTDAGEPFDCDICHGATASTQVQSAVAADDTSCTACHADADHAALHEVTMDASCAVCHTGTNLLGIHSAGCASCHDSADPDVIAAIDAGSRQCSACHSAQGVDYHLNMAVHFAPESYETCGSCHHAWGSNPTRGPDVLRHAGGCTTCHNSTLELEGLTTKCANCHIENGTDYHPNFATAHTPLDAASTDCGRCHGTTDVSVLHTTAQCATCHSGGCSDCHSMHGAPKTTTCSRCHTTSGTNYHIGFASAHTFTGMNASCQQAGCHTSILVDAHSAYVGAGGRYPQYADTCELCHLNDDASRVPAGATADCASCHPSADHESLHVTAVPGDCSGCHAGTSLTVLHAAIGCDGCHASSRAGVAEAIDAGQRTCAACHVQPHGDLGAVHTATTTSGLVDVFGYHEGYSPITWEVPCTLCHASMNLIDEHAGACEACHSGVKPADSFTTWNKGCQQGACHATIDHPAADPAHNSFDCEAACHEPSWYVYYSSCDWCHNPSATAPVTSSNVKATYVGSATIALSAPGITWTYYRLDGGPRASGTSVTVAGPANGSAAHTIEYWSVDDAGNEEIPHKTANFTITADMVQPVTTSNAKTSYVGPAAITLAATDNNSSPVQGTYWKLDGGAQTTGTTINVAQPASGQRQYVLEFWSVDAGGNEELPHKTVTFTITADLVAPTGSIVIKAGADYTTSTSVMLTTTAADNGGSGVSQMRFSTDNVTWSAWQAYAVSRIYTLPSVNGTKTVWVQYRDVAGNTSTYSDSIVYDSVAPTGSIMVNSGAASTTTLGVTLTLNATDALSGVSSARFSNNASSWSAWEPYATSRQWTLASGAAGTRIVYVQIRDGAGNVRQYSDAITLTATDSIAPTGSIAINGGAGSTNSTAVTLNLAASDTGGSGLTQMRFGNDNVNWTAWEPYAATKSWTLPVGDGAKMVYVQYRDGVGNASTYSDGISLDTAVPTGTIFIDAGASTTNKTAVTLTLAAADTGPAGISQMQFSNNDGDWSAWEAYATTKSWTLTSGNGEKTVHVKFRDAAGNVSASYSDTIILDTGALPVSAGQLAISSWTWVDANDGSSGPWATYKIYVNDILVGTKSASADPAWTCPQIDLPGASHIDIVVDCGFTNVGYVFDESRPHTYTFALPAGATRLEAATWVGFPNLGITNEWWDDYEDYYSGVWVPTATIAGITYTSSGFTDTTQPTGSIVVNGGAASTGLTGVALTLSASDAGGTGVSQMQFSSDNATWSAWETYATAKSWTLASGDGVKTVYVRYRDKAGNVSPVYSDTITLTTSANATLAFVWHPSGWAEAHLRVTDAAGGVVVDRWVSGYGADLDLHVTVQSGQQYYMECLFYYDDDTGDEGGSYGKWTSDTSINADGVISPGETVVWYY